MIHINIGGVKIDSWGEENGVQVDLMWKWILTWKTVRRLCQKLSKLLRGLNCDGSKLNFPPNTCMPRRANITINRNKSRSKDAIDWMEFNKDATRFDSDRQYL